MEEPGPGTVCRCRRTKPAYKVGCAKPVSEPFLPNESVTAPLYSRKNPYPGKLLVNRRLIPARKRTRAILRFPVCVFRAEL